MKKIIRSSEITPESVFMMKRRNLLKLLGAGTAGLMVSPSVSAGLFSWFSGDDKPWRSGDNLKRPQLYKT